MISTRKAGGFIIPQRTMTQMFFSAANGMISLLSEKTRVGFIDSLEKGIIQEGVLSQATAGPMMMLSLFHELQNPLFKKHKFDPTEFLSGLVPALENFHNVSSALENELHDVKQRALSNDIMEVHDEKLEQTDGAAHETTEEFGAVTKEEKESLLSALRIMSENDEFESKQQAAEAILNHEWMNETRDFPDSLAAQLSRMVTKELFQINQLSSKTAFLLQNQSRDIYFREGSCRVNNVALLSARACLFKEKEGSSSEDTSDDDEGVTKYEAVDSSFENDFDESETAVAAQLEVLYDVTQEFVMGKPPLSDSNETNESTASTSWDNEKPTQTTIVSVATLEGWLHGGPDDGQLRWKLASYRPPYEFPGIEHAYKY
jgi:hypothetical protein